MSNVKTITHAQAISIAIERTNDLPEVNEVLVKMHAQLVKPRKAVVSKARLMNENLAQKVAGMLHANGNTAKEIVGFGIPEILTTQKATAVMRVACDMGLAVKIKDGKRIAYKPLADEAPELED